MKRMLMKTLRRPNRLASLKCTDKKKKKANQTDSSQISDNN